MDVATESIPTQSRLSLEELEALPEFQNLTDKQARLVKTFLATNNRDSAVKAGYGADMTAEQVRVGTYVYFNAPRVAACIDRVLGVGAKERLLADLDSLIRNSRATSQQVRAAELKMHALGLKPEQPAELSPEVQELISKVVRDGIQERLAELSQPNGSDQQCEEKRRTK